MHRIALLYGDTVKNNDFAAKNMSIITGEVQAVVPVHTVEEYASGDINQEAFLETIGVVSVDR